MTDTPKFRVGDIVGSQSNPGFEYEVLSVDEQGKVGLEVVKGFCGVGSEYHPRVYAEGILHLLRPAVSKPAVSKPAFTLLDAQDGLTILDAESRKALKVGDRVLVECEITAMDCDGGFEVSPFHPASHLCAHTFPEGVYAKLPAAKKEIAVGDFVSILRRTGSKGKVLAFMSNGHAVVEYVAGDDFNVGHYDVSCLEVI